MIHLFHGFLGKPEDLSFFNEFGPTKAYDMKSFDPESFKALEDDFLVGYSMGGRVALRMASRLKYRIKKVIILSSNPHSLSEIQRQGRTEWEEKMKELMLNNSAADFLSIWNNLEIFKNDLPISNVSDEELKIWSTVFDRYRLSEQKDYLVDLKNNSEKFSWIVGSLDEKYLAIAQASGVKFHTINAGHRLFQKPQEVIKLIKEQKLL